MATAGRLKTVGFALVAVILLFIILEIGLRLLLGISTEFLQRREDIAYEHKLWQLQLFDSFMGMHRSDPELFWRMKPNFTSSLLETNSDGFIGPEIRPKKPGEYRIVFLGDSTPLGIGLPDWSESFVFQAGDLLETVRSGSVTVINTSTAGYTSWQCRRLLELEGDRLEPDLVVTYIGNNDPSINGHISDRQLYELTSEFAGLKRVLAKSYLYQVLKGFWLSLRTGGDQAELVPRVAVTEFGENLAAIAAWCRQRNVDLAVCTVPTPLLWPPAIQFKPFALGKDVQGRLVMSEEMRSDIGGQWALCLDSLLLPGREDVWTSRVYASAYVDKGDPILTERFYRQQLETDPKNPQYLNNLAVVIWRQGGDASPYLKAALEQDPDNPAILYNLGIVNYRSDPALAGDYLSRARELDDYSLRIKSDYNETMRDFGTEHNIMLIELVRLFADKPESEYFVDHCHPTEKGHRLIADRLSADLGPLVK
jgi:lysophospholipase L1-like esterase